MTYSWISQPMETQTRHSLLLLLFSSELVERKNPYYRHLPCSDQLSFVMPQEKGDTLQAYPFYWTISQIRTFPFIDIKEPFIQRTNEQERLSFRLHGLEMKGDNNVSPPKQPWFTRHKIICFWIIWRSSASCSLPRILWPNQFFMIVQNKKVWSSAYLTFLDKKSFALNLSWPRYKKSSHLSRSCGHKW